MMMLESCDCHPSGAVICFFFFIELSSQRLKLQITQIYKLLSSIIINYHDGCYIDVRTVKLGLR